MNVPSNRGVILGLLLAALVFHLAVAWQDIGVLAKNGFLYDDSFYAFKIAENIAHGRGMTFDGATPTNGFQPLYVLLLVPFFAAAGSSLTAPIYGALSLSALLTALSAVLLYRLLRRYVRDGVAAVTSIVWAFSPIVTRQSANGLETSLALFLFAACVYFYVSRIRSADRPRRQDFLVMGLLLGLAALARVDQVFVALAMLLDYLLVLRKRGTGARTLPGVAAAVVAGIVVYSPWLVVSAIGAGAFWQDSGAATRFLSIAYAPLFNLGSTETMADGPSASFIWGHVLHALAVLKISPPVHLVFRALEKIGVTLGAGAILKIVADALGILFIVLFVYPAMRRGKGRTSPSIGELRFLLIVAVVLISAYSFYVFGVFFFTRYLYPVYFIACVYAAFLLEMLVTRPVRLGRPARAIVAAGLVLYAAGFAYMSFTSAFRTTPVYFFYDVARWVREHTDPDEKIGVFQGGAIGYFSHRTVVNLDGKVNRGALDALKGHRLPAYLEQEGIDVILDSSNVLNLFLFENEKGGLRRYVALEKIMNGSREGFAGWVAYRFHGWEVEGVGGVPGAPHSSPSN
ncbi:MAG: glycosyltransferase family 39 protein [Candidatus Krumholzibacteriia bacterium]